MQAAESRAERKAVLSLLKQWVDEPRQVEKLLYKRYNSPDLYHTAAYELLGTVAAQYKGVKLDTEAVLPMLETFESGWEGCAWQLYREQTLQAREYGIKSKTGSICAATGMACKNYRCKQPNVFFYTEQSCKCDEAVTVRFMCTFCGTRWKG